MSIKHFIIPLLFAMIDMATPQCLALHAATKDSCPFMQETVQSEQKTLAKEPAHLNIS